MTVKLDLAAFGKRLRSLREARGLTQAQLATVVGGGNTKISEWESGGRAPDVEGLLRAAMHLGTTADFLLTGSQGAGEWTQARLLALVRELQQGAWREEPPDLPPADPKADAEAFRRMQQRGREIAEREATERASSQRVAGARPNPPIPPGKGRK